MRQLMRVVVGMQPSRVVLAFVLSAGCAGAWAQAAAPTFAQKASATAHKTERAVVKGVSRAASGVERGMKAAGRGVEKGAKKIGLPGAGEPTKSPEPGPDR